LVRKFLSLLSRYIYKVRGGGTVKLDMMIYNDILSYI